MIGFYAGWLVAQADDMPTWNPGDEFEAARKKAWRSNGDTPHLLAKGAAPDSESSTA